MIKLVDGYVKILSQIVNIRVGVKRSNHIGPQENSMDTDILKAAKVVQELNKAFDNMRELGNRGEGVFKAELFIDDSEISISLLVNQYDDKGMIVGDYNHYKCLMSDYGGDFLSIAKEEYARLAGLWALNPVF
jgi:hypothetical protein